MGSMNSTMSFGLHKTDGLRMGIPVGILLIFATFIFLALYFSIRIQTTSEHTSALEITIAREPPHLEMEPPHPHHHHNIVLDEETLSSYPKLLYSELEAKLRNKDSTATCCSICLGDYKESDILRLLPDCGHLFHLKCVDPWLRLHPSCPVCRMSLLPIPLSTPLAEVATRRDIG